MSQHDYDIANQIAPNARADLNLALKALASTSSGSAAPTTTFANMIYYNTSTNILYKRNEADSAWISLGTIDEGLGTFTPSGSPALATQAEAQAGTNNTALMTPLRVAQAIDTQVVIPAPTTGQVGTATAGLSVGAVGSYAFLRKVSEVIAAAGSTHAGSGLVYSNAQGANDTGTPSGTWRLMGRIGTVSGATATSVFLRIS